MKMRLGMQIVLALLLSLMTTSYVYAQATAANATGRVTGTDGQGLDGVTIELIHVPSGTRSRTTTDADGRWSARGLRVGGPYTVSATGAGLQSIVQEDVFFLLGETGTVNLSMERSAELGRVTVTGVALSDVFDPMKMGAGTNVTRQQIEALPSINRNIQDYIRTDPRISQVDKERGEISAGGQNTRFNNIRIDGVSTNDAFGLESNNLPTDRQPISIDSIEEINISLANFDVALAGYTGASVDAVTKSGTNQFEGTAYYIYRDNDWVGKRDGNKFTGFEDETTYGITFGGPIIKDRLFFFVAYEQFDRSAQAPVFGPAGSGASQIVTGISTADIARVQQIARDVWGFDAGSFDPPSSLDTDIEDILIKLDWNISDNHRASLRYNKTEQIDPFLRSIGPRSLSLSSYWHNSVKEFTGYVGQLYSDWTDTFSTEFKVSYAEQRANWDNFARLPQIQICLNSSSCSGADSIFLGTERFRHVNVLETDTFNVFGAGNLFLGDHEIKFGFEYQEQDIFNLFGRDQFGVYQFVGIDNFAAGTPSTFSLFYPTQGGVETRAADWTLKNWGFFLQDTWAVNYKLNIMAGIRLDIPKVGTPPLFNASASSAFGVRNDNTIDGNQVWQPRLGFNYSFDTERRTQLRGGVGLFQGAAANVWLSNPFTNNSISAGAISLSGAAAAAAGFSPDPDNQPGARPPPGLGGIVDFIDPDLKQPTVWKLNVALDHELPWWGLIGTAELLLTDVKNGIYYEKPNLGEATGFLPDGRPYYWSTVTPGQFTGAFGQAGANRNRDFNIDSTIARPTGKGKGQQLTLSLQKPQTENWFWNVAYTYTYATEVNPLTSSQAASNWNNSVRADRNANISERSIYAIKDRFTASVGYSEFFFSDLKTSVAMFYEGRSGRPFSYTFINDANGDGRSGVDLFYVPSGPGDVIFTGGAAMEQAFFDFLARNPGLDRYRGEVARANAERSPWAHNFDLRISQELPGFWRGKSEVWMDVINIGNLINKKWGRIEQVGFPYGFGVARFEGIDPATGRLVMNFNENNVRDLTLQDNRGESRWAVQLGFRYKF
jgi:hypothetical protein